MKLSESDKQKDDCFHKSGELLYHGNLLRNWSSEIFW